MQALHRLAALAAVVATATLFATMACAQIHRTFVSGTGDDANPCTRISPCQTFTGALAKSASGGQINCLDSGDYGAVEISKAITINCQGVIAGITAISEHAVIVDAPAGSTVQLIGLDIDGLGPVINTGVNGVEVSANVNVAIINCVIHGFRSANNGNGVLVFNSAAGAHVLVENSDIRDNINGIKLAGAAAGSVLIDHSVLESNTTANLALTTSFTTAVIQASTLAGSPTAISNTGGAAVISYGNNLIRNAGAPTQTLPLQ